MRWWIWFRGWLKNQKQMEALPEKKAEEQKSFFLYMRMAPEILTRMRRERGIPLKELELVLIDNENEPVWQVQAILETLFGSTGEDTPGGFPIRKLAHFTEFACLGALLFWRFGMLRRPKALAFCLGAAAACIDEGIQMFVPGRGPGIRDVGIDCGGVLTGMIFLYLGHTYFQRKRKNKSMEDS